MRSCKNNKDRPDFSLHPVFPSGCILQRVQYQNQESDMGIMCVYIALCHFTTVKTYITSQDTALFYYHKDLPLVAYLFEVKLNPFHPSPSLTPGNH